MYGRNGIFTPQIGSERSTDGSNLRFGWQRDNRAERDCICGDELRGSIWKDVERQKWVVDSLRDGMHVTDSTREDLHHKKDYLVDVPVDEAIRKEQRVKYYRNEDDQSGKFGT